MTERGEVMRASHALSRSGELYRSCEGDEKDDRESFRRILESAKIHPYSNRTSPTELHASSMQPYHLATGESGLSSQV